MFVPVLLGAGVVLSALAWVVDRVARLTAVPTMERGLARKLATCSRSRTASSASRRPIRSHRDEAHRWSSSRLVAVTGSSSIGELGDLTQSRPEPVRDDAVTELVLSVRRGALRAGPRRAAAALWAVCSAQTRSRPTGDGELRPLGDGRYRVVLTPAVGHHEQRKLVGCLEDLTVDRVVGDVESFRTVSLSDE